MNWLQTSSSSSASHFLGATPVGGKIVSYLFPSVCFFSSSTFCVVVTQKKMKTDVLWRMKSGRGSVGVCMSCGGLSMCSGIWDRSLHVQNMTVWHWPDFEVELLIGQWSYGQWMQRWKGEGCLCRIRLQPAAAISACAPYFMCSWGLLHNTPPSCLSHPVRGCHWSRWVRSVVLDLEGYADLCSSRSAAVRPAW